MNASHPEPQQIINTLVLLEGRRYSATSEKTQQVLFFTPSFEGSKIMIRFEGENRLPGTHALLDYFSDNELRSIKQVQ